MSSKKIILVIGATGAQGRPVIDALLANADDGTPSPYAVRALTRDPASRRAQELTEKGVECVQGSFDDFAAVAKAFEGVYGAWVNTDGFTVGEQKEMYCGMRIFEIAKQTKTVRHYVWSSLDYSTKKGGYNPEYKVEHTDAKGRVADWMKAQPSVVSDHDMSWSVVTSGPYMELLNIPMYGPLNIRKDGTFVFASPIGDGHMHMIALSDLGWWARYTFDHRSETSAQDLEIASEMVGWDHVVSTFTKVTSQPAVFKRLTLDEWWANFTNTDKPIANERERGDGSTTTRQNFSAFLRQFRDDIIHRDIEWIRKVHPKSETLESWMKKTGYTGRLGQGVLKNIEDGKSIGINFEKVKEL